METLVTVSISKHITEGFKKVQVPFHKIKDLVKSDFNYSAGIFLNGYRKRDNYANYSDMIILDVDDGLSIKEASKLMQPMTHIIATTKSHQKDKNGIVCDRFRILIPTETPINLNQNEYTKLMKQVLKKYSFCDQVCKDASRFYFPSRESEVFHWQGFTNFNWEDYYKLALDEEKKENESKSRLKQFYKNYQDRQPTHSFEDTKTDYLRKILNTQKLLDLLKFDTKFGAGSRNNYLYSVGCYLRDNELEDEEIKNTILWVNSCGDGISEDEIRKTIFKSLRVA